MMAVVRRFEDGPEAAAQALGMRWSGREGVGPCPACGGRDRCHVAAYRRGDGRILVGCRQCDDRDALGAAVDKVLGPEPPDPRRVLAWAAARPRFSRRAAPSRVRRTAPSLPGRPSRSSDESGERSEAARCRDVKADSPAAALWSAAEAPEGSPARRYVRDRRIWPPEGLGFPALPQSVRWLPRDRVPKLKGGLRTLPEGVGGAILYCFTDAAGGLRGLQAEALSEAGSRLPWPGRDPDPKPPTRLNVGVLQGAAFLARDDRAPTVCVIVEGPADALAESLRVGQEARVVLAAGGAGGFPALALREAPRRDRLILVPDDDPSGRHAARKASLALHRAGFEVPERRIYAGSDPAEALDHEVQEREAIRDPDGNDPESALRGAWTDLLRQKEAIP